MPPTGPTARGPALRRVLAVLSAVLLGGLACRAGDTRSPAVGEPVASAPAPVNATPDCASRRPEWIWCDDFEEDRLGQYFEHKRDDGNFVRVPGVGHAGSVGMRARFGRRGQVAGGTLHLAFGKTPSPYFRPVDAGTALYREISWRLYVRYEPGWIGGGGYKLARAQSLVTREWAQAMVAHLWNSEPPNETRLAIAPASGTDPGGVLRTRSYNDFRGYRWLGTARSRTPIFDRAHVGRWYCIEARARLNDPGRSNGVFELWIDGAPEGRLGGLNWLGSFDAYGINAVFIENYWNGGAPQAQERYFDNFVVSTQPIGC